MPPAAGLTYERRGSGEPMLLLHGLGGELGVWEPVLDALTAEHDVIAVDLPGFGASAPLAGCEEQTSEVLSGTLV
jgi:pimeloyl-ACP methyl ester carboxylesterase